MELISFLFSFSIVLIQSKYHSVAFILAFVFCLYNVGLPIVISACPMTSNKTEKFTSCADTQTDGLKITSTKNTSCCKIIIAAQPNNTEYLQVKFLLENPNFIGFVFIQTSHELNTPSCSSYIGSVTSSSSPPVKDIPVFTSSLLI